jgi:hypothetical protein
MSLATYPNSSKPVSPSSRSSSTIGSRLRKSFSGIGRALVKIFDAIAEARAQKAMIEAELYRKRYLRTSKNDDDLPIVR